VRLVCVFSFRCISRCKVERSKRGSILFSEYEEAKLRPAKREGQLGTSTKERLECVFVCVCLGASLDIYLCFSIMKIKKRGGTPF
jgi:hypothetical protein